MKNLKTKISELTPDQIESIVQFLLTLSDDYILDYLLYLIDNEYLVSNMVDEKVEKFVSDVRFKKFRNTILEKVKKKKK